MISDFNKLNCQNVTQKLWRQNLSSFSGSVKNQLELSHDMPQACKFEPFYLFVSMCSNDHSYFSYAFNFCIIFVRNRVWDWPKTIQYSGRMSLEIKM